MADSDKYTLRLSLLTGDCTRAQTERTLESICKRALKLSRVEHLLEAEVIGEEDHFEAMGVPAR